ncbi:choice-of-anchor H family protein [uncultured Shewanella sp.]|uniref:choice-of-anchor H family protein n=1 Tax=uncultured Shewanella sp. TaxID=173975 RepID=UPI002608B66B|nr:choice-of-anchor H family protein [uncultured Shewanella sp.]
MDIQTNKQKWFNQMAAVIGCVWMLTLSLPVTAQNTFNQNIIVVSEGRQVNNVALAVEDNPALTAKQQQSLKLLVAEERAKRKSDIAQGKSIAVRATREQIMSERKAGILSAVAQRSVNDANAIAKAAAEKAKVSGNVTDTNLGLNQESNHLSNHVQQQSIIGYRDFDIYDAYSRIFDDFDEDGFYQTFSVTFDADVYGFTQGEPANVYAELYLSRNGGPWEHYYSTEVFTIYGDATDDDYEVLTTLAQGYKTDYYDVLIDLYELGYEDIVATLSADESDGLYALPLESSDRDEVYEQEYVEVIESEVIVSGGSLSLTALLMLLMMRLYRLKA